MKPYLASIADAQRALGVGRTTAYRLIETGILEKVKIGRRTLIKVTSIQALAGEMPEAAHADTE
jgi:excisionase family DNA binding protein